MNIRIFQVDAFADTVFGGNPAAVCPLDRWLPDETLQKIALENCVAETAFFVPLGDGFEIRWFTPEIEMDLCGHATLATAHVIVRHLYTDRSSVQFQSVSGMLSVAAHDDLLTLDLPSRIPKPASAPQIVLDAIQAEPVAVLRSRDYVLVFESEEIIRNLVPDQSVFNEINLDPGGVAVTAPGDDVDFVSRYFTPQASIFEDPVTGSAHCSLVPYWSRQLGKKSLTAQQLSSRGGTLHCKDAGERVFVSGQAVTYLEGVITV